MVRFYLYAGLACIVLYTGMALFGVEFGGTRVKKVTPAEQRAAAARRSSGGYYGGGGFGGGK